MMFHAYCEPASAWPVTISRGLIISFSNCIECDSDVTMECDSWLAFF